MPAFGTFKSFSSFLDAYQDSQQQEARRAEANLPLSARLALRRRERDIVEVSATVHVHEPNDSDGDQHIRLRVQVTDVLASDPDVDADVRRCVDGREGVFVAIRIGDRMGILHLPTAGMDPGNRVHLRGEWITREKAHDHGGEKMSVLHFTHHPIGFLCVETPQEACYS